MKAPTAPLSTARLRSVKSSGLIGTWAIHWSLPPRSFQYLVTRPMTWSSSRRIAVLMPHCSHSSHVSKTFSSVKYCRSSPET